MGIGPLVAWRKASLRSLGKTFLVPFAAAVVTGGILLGLGFDSSWAGLLAYTFSAFVVASIVLEFVRGRAAAGGIFRLVSRNRRRYGGYWSTPLSSSSRSGSPARARTRRSWRTLTSGPGSRWRSTATRPPTRVLAA